MSGRSRDSGLLLAPSPRADLLPEEIRTDRHARSVRRSLRYVLLVAVLVAVGSIGVARLQAERSTTQLQAERARTQTLLAQQRRYTDVTSARTRLTSTQLARQTTTSTGIKWRQYLEAVSATLPSGVSIVSVDIDSAAPGSQYVQASTPLQGPRVATLAFHVSTKRLSSVEHWVDKLSSLPGFVDATPAAVTTATASGTGAPSAAGLLDAAVSVHIGAAAYTAVPSAAPLPIRKPKPTPTPRPTPTPTPTPMPTVTVVATPIPTVTVTATAKPKPSQKSTKADTASANGGKR